MLFYRAALPLSSRTLTFVAGIIRRYRVSIGSCWRKLNSGQQALLVLVYLRKGETFAELAAGFVVATTTAWSPPTWRNIPVWNCCTTPGTARTTTRPNGSGAR